MFRQFRWITTALIAFAFGREFLRTDEPQRLTIDGRVKRDPVWLDPQGNELLYVTLDRPNRLRLMKHVVATGLSTPLHPDETRAEFEPAVSADGRYLAYVQSRGNLSLALVVQDLIDNKITELPPGGGFSGMHSPTFFLDAESAGSVRVFYSYPEERRQSIFSVDVDCKNRRTVVDSIGVNNWPHVSPDGKRLVFASSRDDDYEIYVADSNGSNTTRLTTSPRQDIRPRFSPDGRRIAFTSNRDGNYEIYVMSADGHDPIRMTSHAEQDDYVLWHPHGSRLLYIGERNGQFDVYSMLVP